MLSGEDHHCGNGTVRECLLTPTWVRRQRGTGSKATLESPGPDPQDLLLLGSLISQVFQILPNTITAGTQMFKHRRKTFTAKLQFHTLSKSGCKVS